MSGSRPGWSVQPASGCSSTRRSSPTTSSRRPDIGPSLVLPTTMPNLALRAGTLLGDAGEQTEHRADVSATVDLLERAVELLPEDLPRRRRLIITLAFRCYDAGDAARSERLLGDVIAEADRAGDEGASALATLMLVMTHSPQQSNASSEQSSDLRQMSRLMQVEDIRRANLGRKQHSSTENCQRRANMWPKARPAARLHRCGAVIPRQGVWVVTNRFISQVAKT